MASKSMLKSKRNIVEELTREQGMWIFTNTECRVNKEVTFTWNSLFKAFQDKEFQFLLQDDMTNELSKEIYKNIIKSGLHQAAIKTLGLPCLDVLEWITWKVDHEDKEILNFENKGVSIYKASILNQI